MKTPYRRRAVKEAPAKDGTVRLRKQRAHQRYYLPDGTQVPGCSTIAKIGSDPAPLLYWAWDCGMRGLDYRKVSENACDIGTIAHFMIECFLQGELPDFSEYAPADVERALPAFEKFKAWWVSERLTTLAVEERLIDPALRYGGTSDYPARDEKGRRCLFDWKTSKGFYPEHAVQLIGLEHLSNTNRPHDLVQRRAVVRIGKEKPGDFDVWWLEFGLDDYWNVFQAKLALYYELRNIKNRGR